MKKIHFKLMAILLFFTLLMGLGSMVGANFPDKGITLVISYSPGGGTDVLARVMEKELEKQFGVPVRFEFKPGAGTAVGNVYVKEQPADGYTLLSWNTPVPEIAATLEEAQFSPRDFVGIGATTWDPFVVGVPANSEINSLEELIEVSQGRFMTMGGVGALSSAGLFWLELHRQDFKGQFIPFDGTADVRNAVIGAHIHSAILNAGQALPLVEDGFFKVLAVASDERVDFLPDVPTMEEAIGVLYLNELYRGFVVRKETPEDRVQFLREAHERAAHTEEVMSKLNELSTFRWYDGEAQTRRMHQLADDLERDAEELRIKLGLK